MKVRTRFAPSPTGFLHVGGVRTALFAWLVARQADGQFILRIEDTDRSRHVEESEKHISDSLHWLGLKWDEGPFRQSERLSLYEDWAQKLIDAGRAYADPYSEPEIDKFRQQAKQQKKPFLFRDFRPEKPPAWQNGMPLRFKSEPKAYQWSDEVMGGLSFGPEAVDDFILIKSDGYPTYNFAHVIDDHDMQISHVIRSQEFLPSIPKFLNLYESLEIERPKLATLPYVMGPSGQKKLSKRDGAEDILDYKREGYLPEALISFLATLGWNDGTEQELFTAEDLIEKFSLSRVQRSGARFDEKRLEWTNSHFIRHKPLDELFKLSEPFWPDTTKNYDDEYKKAVLVLVQERLKHLSELPELTGFFFSETLEDFESNPLSQKFETVLPRNNKNMVKAVISELEPSDFSVEDLKNRLNSLLDKLDTSPRILFSVIRIATTQAAVSPDLFGTLNVLGRDVSLKRLRDSIS
jgi:glutamyl-tRNA synthetase